MARKSRPAANGTATSKLAGTDHHTVPAPADSRREDRPTALYGVSPVKRLRRTRTELAAIDDAIVAAVESDWPVTLRGVYYRVVSAAAVDKTEAGYQLVGRQLLKLRRDGTIPYARITDGTRLIRKPDSWTGVEEALDDLSASYRRALWHDQDVHVIVLSEKDAISGVIYPVTARWDVELAITRGYSSETFTHSIARTIIEALPKTTYLYQLGDHDPSGLDAWRSFTERVHGFVADELADAVKIAGPLDPAGIAITERLAVTPGQIGAYGLPTRPTKRSDTRAAGFDGESVEVDAIPAPALRSIVEDAITGHIDTDQLAIHRMVERNERAWLADLAAGGAA